VATSGYQPAPTRVRRASAALATRGGDLAGPAKPRCALVTGERALARECGFAARVHVVGLAAKSARAATHG